MPTKTLATLLRVVCDHGYPAEKALQQIGLDFNPLNPDELQPTQVPTTSYSNLYQLLMQVLQDEAFGLGQEYHSPPGTFRMMCLFIIHCKTLGSALERSAEFFDYCNLYRSHALPSVEPPIRILDDEKHALCLFERYPAFEREQGSILYSNMLLMMYRFYSWLIGKELPLKEVWLRGQLPDSLARYETLFNCPVSFEQEKSGLVVSVSLLQQPVVQNEETLKEFLKQTPYRLVRPGKPQGDKPLTRKVEQILLSNSIQKPPSAERVAAQLNMSARTLHRKLTLENASFQTIKDEYRKDLAIHYISRPELTIDAIAALMGFQDNSAFYRSFKKWTGESPGGFRTKLLEEAKLHA